MRATVIAACFLSVTAAAGEDLNMRAHPLSLPLDGQKNLTFSGQPDLPKRELLGDALGNWMGVKAGRWDVFQATLFDDGTLDGKGNGPTVAATVRKNVAEIQLRWRSGE